MTFNPLYNRQFAVIDPLGAWSIWDIEHNNSRSTPYKLTPGKQGGIYDHNEHDMSSKPPANGRSDGWHRILWVLNVTTILVCNRNHLAVFDLRSGQERLDTTELKRAIGSDMILDIRRSASDLRYVFLLTTTQVMWIEICLVDSQQIGGHGVILLLSYKHFRDGSDRTLRLATVRDDYRRFNPSIIPKSDAYIPLV